ncbi:MAG TPA: hypothetical protein VNV85_13200 [Puia sp.]|jgi:hypothetical protein|nr:hypothetical protein [Puia sp.]
MELRIEKGVLIKDKQAEFNVVYPYLKIEFFKLTHLQTDGRKQLDKVKSKPVPVGSSERFTKSATINIEGKTTAYTLEKQFLEKFDLSIKLFRKSGSLWIETTLTENWSLEKQNEEGEFMSSPMVHQKSFGDDAGDDWMEKE